MSVEKAVKLLSEGADDAGLQEEEAAQAVRHIVTAAQHVLSEEDAGALVPLAWSRGSKTVINALRVFGRDSVSAERVLEATPGDCVTRVRQRLGLAAAMKASSVIAYLAVMDREAVGSQSSKKWDDLLTNCTKEWEAVLLDAPARDVLELALESASTLYQVQVRPARNGYTTVEFTCCFASIRVLPYSMAPRVCSEQHCGGETMLQLPYDTWYTALREPCWQCTWRNSSCLKMKRMMPNAS